MIKKFINYYKQLHQADINIPMFILKSAYYHFLSKNIFAPGNTIIRGLENIEICGRLFIGTEYVGFLNRHDRVFLNIRGKLVIQGDVHIGKGCRLDIDKGAVCTLRQCAITGQASLIIAHSLEIGEESLISWGCEFLDEDWHIIQYEGKREKQTGIVIGKHVWIGSHVKILKGVRIGNNSVIATNAVVTKPFQEDNVLIAGNPAEIIRRDIQWKPLK